MSQVILITGCSSGIGRDLAQSLTGSGYNVVATARKVATLEGLPAAVKLPLDVARSEDVRQAVECTLQRFGRIDVLVNNAGYAQVGVLEEVPLESVQQMFEANVFGALRMIQAVLPIMRKQGSGRIINISSIAGKCSTPVNGAYSATKFAIEALSDALRLELAPFGIQVISIEPGSVDTNFDRTVEGHAQAILSNPYSPYRALYQKYAQVSDGMRKNRPGPQAVSQTIQKAIGSKKPNARYLVAVPFSGKVVMALGDGAWDLVVKQLFKLTPGGVNRV